MFIISTDLSTAIYPEIKQAISRSSDIVVLTACKTAEKEIEDSLGRRYLIRPELEKTGDARDPLLVMIGRDIAVYHLYALTESLPAKIVKRYDDAVRVLNDYASGEKTLTGIPAAPEPEATTPDGKLIGYGGRPPRATLL